MPFLRTSVSPRSASTTITALLASSLWAVSLAGCGNTETQPTIPHNQLLATQGCRTCAVKEGALDCWGQLEPKPALPVTPTRIALPGPVEVLATSATHTCVTLSESAGVYCWGANDLGQLGTPVSMTNPTDPVKTPVKSAFPATSKMFVMGEGFTCVLDGTSSVKCAGGVGAVLGNGQDIKSDIPIAVPSLATITSLVGGLHHACALDKDGVVACWGKNAAGQCGQAGSDDVDFAAHVMIPPADKIWAGEDFTCAHTTAGEAYCWGNNAQGQFGSQMLGGGGGIPIKVPLDKYKELALGGYRSCGVDAQGGVDCWGLELAQKPMVAVPPTRVDTIVNPNQLVSGSQHHCAWAGGILYCWGQNDCGQLGVGGTLQTAPVPLAFP